jgi:hypothetical protein
VDIEVLLVECVGQTVVKDVAGVEGFVGCASLSPDSRLVIMVAGTTMNSELPHKLEYAGAEPLDGPRRISRLAVAALLMTIGSILVTFRPDVYDTLRSQLGTLGIARGDAYRGAAIILMVPDAMSLGLSCVARWRIKKPGSGLRGQGLAATALVLSALATVLHMLRVLFLFSLAIG